MQTWILILTMPSGSKWALGERKKTLALFPINPEKPTPLRAIFGFETKEKALSWIEEFSKINPKTDELLKRVEPHLATVPN